MLKTWNQQAIIGLQAKGYIGRENDETRPGLALVFSARGVTWEWQRRVNKVPRTIKLGNFPALGLSDARTLAANINSDLAQGVDVYVKYGVGAKSIAVGPRTASNNPGVMTGQEAWHAWIAVSKNKASTLSEKQRMWKNDFLGPIGEKLITEITEDDLLAVTEPMIDDTPGKHNTTVAYLKAFFTWAKKRKRTTGLTSNPAEDLEKVELGERKRFLSE